MHSADDTETACLVFTCHCVLQILRTHISFVDKSCMHQNPKTIEKIVETAHPYPRGGSLKKKVEVDGAMSLAIEFSPDSQLAAGWVVL